jgi:hypothetical protein
MASVFWSCEGSLWIKFLETRVSVLGDTCHNQFGAICTDTKEFKTTNSKGPAKKEDESSLLLDNARPQTILRTKEAVATVGGLWGK